MKIITSGYTQLGVVVIFFLYAFLIFSKSYLKTFPKCYLKICITFIIRKKCYNRKKLKFDDGIAYRVKFKIICSGDHGT